MTHEALLIAHGSPADPAPQEAALAGLAARVSHHLPGWTVRSATLAAEGALEAALAGLDQPLIYPFFMAEGWFTRTTLPKRLAAAGRGDLPQLAAFGHDAALPELLERTAMTAARQAGYDPQKTHLVLAAHGSQVSRASATITEQMAQTLRQRAAFAAVSTGYVEEAPLLQDTLVQAQGAAVCLPCFATRAGHVLDDLPEAVEASGFEGLLLDPIGEHPEVAGLIAAALMQARLAIPT